MAEEKKVVSAEEILTDIEASKNAVTPDKSAPAETVAEETVSAEPSDLKRKPPVSGRKKKKSRLSLLIRMVIIIALSVMFSVVIIFGFKDVYGLEFGDAPAQDIYIEKGSSTAQIAKVLHENEIIDQPLLFRIFCKLGNTGDFQYGYHTFSGNMSYAEITAELQKLARKKDVVEVTVIEGWTLYDIAKELKAKDVISDINDFTKTVERMQVNYSMVSKAPENKYRYYKYEGYFYPDKYEFYTGTNDYEGIAKKFFANFEAHIDSEIKKATEESSFTFDEILTLASLIQAEAGDVNQMGKVSSVFHNRLKNSLFPNLQSDVTINYVEKVIKPTVGYTYQELYDAYNTYKCIGLMPGPICNPSREAIRAALFPDSTNYYYFVTDHAGKYYYATTFAQHQKNCATAQRVNSKIDG